MSFINSILHNNNEIKLYNFRGDFKTFPETDLFSGAGKKICFLDVETTGANRQNDEIIEIALKSVLVNDITGNIINIEEEYQSFNAPGIPISKEAHAVNGITEEMISNKKINWEIVKKIISSSDIIVAHNVYFDRAFIDRYLPLSKEKLWACSINDINWLSRGFTSSKQELLCIWHGFYYESHRAMGDVDALINLVTHESYKDNKPVLELIKNSTFKYFRVFAVGSPFEKKEELKSRRYKWDNQKKCWWKRVLELDLNTEKDWLSDKIYSGFFEGRVEEISYQDRYK